MHIVLRHLSLMGLLWCGSASWSYSATATPALEGVISPTPKVVRLFGSVEYQGEFAEGLSALGWQNEAIPVENAIALTGRFDKEKIDMVVAGTLINNFSKVDFQPDIARWKGWMSKGNCLLVTDCSSIYLMNLWINAFGNAIIEPEGTSTLWRENDQSRPLALSDAGDQQLTTVPNILTNSLGMKPGPNVWSAFAEVPPGWSGAMTDPQGKKLFINKNFDLGSLVLTKFYSFQGPDTYAATRALLENTWCQTICARHGISLRRVVSPTGNATVGLQITNTEKKAMQASSPGLGSKMLAAGGTMSLNLPVKDGISAVVKFNRDGRQVMTLQLRQ